MARTRRAPAKASDASVLVPFEVERMTKNTVRFAEIAEEGAEHVRTLYVQQSTLDEMGWSDGQGIVISISLA